MSTIEILGISGLAVSVLFTFYNALNSQAKGLQSVRESLAEAWTNIAIGFSINFVANMVILPLADAPISYENNFWVGCIYTAISFFRSFFIRRYYNWRAHRI
jgi:hypothetical protein